MAHHFISYSTVDDPDFALRLYDALEGGTPSHPAWLDKRDLKPGIDWDLQIRDALRDCTTVLFVMTPDSVADNSVCRQEWSLALSYKKIVVPLRRDPAAEAPFRLQNRQHIDFSGDFDAGIARLRQHLEWLKSPAGVLQRMKDQLADAERDLRRTRDAHEQARIEREMVHLREDITRQQALVDNPGAVIERAEASIAARIEVERQPERAPRTTTKFINPPPMTAPTYFQDRFDQTRQIADFLRDESLRLLTLVGTGGVGKTATVCRVLKALHAGHLPDDLGPLAVDGIVYLSTGSGPYRVSAPTLFEGLSKLLSPDDAAAFDALYRDARIPSPDKLRALLEHFPAGRTVVLLDNFEDVVDLETRTIRDTDLDEVLRALLEAPSHVVKVILTTRVKPGELPLIHPERQRVYELDQGLASPYAENILREMDDDGALGLRGASPAMLDEARQLTRGFPRALEALVAILRSDRDTRLDELLADLRRWHARQPVETMAEGVSHVVQKLVGEAFNRLDGAARQVMQALAIYNRPVPAVAVDYLLQPYAPGLDSETVLGRLVNMHFARRDAGRYYLHPVDGAYALELVPRGERPDRVEQGEPLFTQVALCERGADYFRSARKARFEWKTLADLDAQLAEIDLRCRAADYDTAAHVLNDISFDYLLLWGHFHLMVAFHQRLQGHLRDVLLRIHSLNNLGLACDSVGRVSEAVGHYESALVLAQENGHRSWEGALLGNLGSVYSVLGKVRRAIECYEQALVIAREIGDRRSEGIQVGNLGTAYSVLGEVRRAIEYHEQALVIAREIGDRRGEGASLGNLGNAYRALGEVRRAIEYYEQALDLAREIGERRGESIHLGNLGLAYRALGEVRRAIEYYEQALDLARGIGYRRGEGIHLGNLGNAYSTLGEVRGAIECYEQALVIAREIGDQRGERVPLGNLGVCFADLGQYDQALNSYRQALAIAREMQYPSGASINLCNIGHILMLQSRWAESIQACQEAIQIADSFGFVQTQNEGREVLALAYLYSGDLPAARAAIEAARQCDFVPNNHNVLVLCGVIALRQGDRPAAQASFTAAITAAGDLLAKTAASYDALDTRGLALSGLALVSTPPGDHARQAADAFRAARAITSAPGIVARVLRLFDALAVADTTGILAGMRRVLIGEE